MKKYLTILLSLFVLAGCGKSENIAKPEVSMPVSEEEYRVSFVGVGDNIIYKGTVLDAASQSGEDREYDFRPIYSEVQDIIEGADVAFINQETVMTGGELSYYPNFNSPQQVGLDLVDIGFDVVNIANNHMLDKGGDGLLKTVEFWQEQPVLTIGVYDGDFQRAEIIEKNGVKIAFLSYTYGTNGGGVAKNSELKIPYVKTADIEKEVENARENADFVIVSVHWGEEGKFQPSSEQKELAKRLADSGVDVILGHHPHVIQPVEWVEGENGNRTLCAYSLGNFAAEQAHDYNMVGGIISFDLVKTSGATTAFSVENPIFTPTVYHFNSRFKENKVYQMKDYTPELANLHGVKNYYKNPLTYDGLIKYAEDTVDAEFLAEKEL